MIKLMRDSWPQMQKLQLWQEWAQQKWQKPIDFTLWEEKKLKSQDLLSNNALSPIQEETLQF